MPFSCQAVVAVEQLREQPLIFDAWVDDVWDRFVDAGTAFAHTHDSQGRCTLRLTGPGVLTARPTIVGGDPIRPGTVVAYFDADGEDIPYGRPYCTLDYEGNRTQ